jgi:hypothetical protein
MRLIVGLKIVLSSFLLRKPARLTVPNGGRHRTKAAAYKQVLVLKYE